jgi:hypothetical protein
MREHAQLQQQGLWTAANTLKTTAHLLGPGTPALGLTALKLNMAYSLI